MNTDTARELSPLDVAVLAELLSDPMGRASAVLAHDTGRYLPDVIDATYSLRVAGLLRQGPRGWRLTAEGEAMARKVSGSAVFEMPIDDQRAAEGLA